MTPIVPTRIQPQVVRPADLPSPFTDLAHHLNISLADDDKPTLAERLGAGLVSFVDNGWKHVTSYRQSQLRRGMGPLDGRLLAAVVSRGGRDIQATWDTHPPEEEKTSALLGARTRALAEHLAERIVAMRVADESDQAAQVGKIVLQEQIQIAHLVATVRRECALLGLSEASMLAPVVFGAVAAQTRYGGRVGTSDVMRELGLDRLVYRQECMSGKLIETIDAAVRDGATLSTPVLEYYTSISREILRPVLPQPGSGDPVLDKFLPLASRPSREPTRGLGSLVAFEATSRDGTAVEARVEAATELLSNILVALRQIPANQFLRGEQLLPEALSALQRMAAVMRSEHACHKDVKRTWAEIEKEYKMELAKAQRGGFGKNAEEGFDTAVATPYPVVEKYPAIESRALYYQAALLSGIPLGVILAELYDSQTLAFGPTERMYLERIAFYAARKYAANYVAEDDRRVDQLDSSIARVADIQMALRKVEEQLRTSADGKSDEELLAHGRELLISAQRAGAIRKREVDAMLGVAKPGDAHARSLGTAPFHFSIVEAMVSRIRAAQEVRALTAVMAVHGSVPMALIQSYSLLPHTTRVALLQDPEAELRHIKARNGQNLMDLERVTRARWFKYRQQAPVGRDVEVIQIPGTPAADTEAPGKVPFQRRTFGRPVVTRGGARGPNPYPRSAPGKKGPGGFKR